MARMASGLLLCEFRASGPKTQKEDSWFLKTSLWKTLVLMTTLAIVTGCAFGAGTATGQQAERNALKEIPGNTVSHPPFAVSAQAVTSFLPRVTRKLVGSGNVFLAYVTLKKLPKAPYVFLEDGRGHVLSRLPYYASFADMTAADLRGYTTDPSSLRILEALKADTSYAKLIVDVGGVRVGTRKVSDLPKVLRKSFSRRDSVKVVEFLTLPPSSKIGASEEPLYITTIVLKPGTTKVGGNYSTELSVPKGLQ